LSRPNGAADLIEIKDDGGRPLYRQQSRASRRPRFAGSRPLRTRIALYVIAALLIAAHFLRGGNFVAVALCLATPLLFLVRRRWSLLVLQGLAFAAAGIWLMTALHLAAERQFFGEPWMRATAILAAVAAVSLLAGGLLFAGKFRERYCGR
jgi:hypothetical protein